MAGNARARSLTAYRMTSWCGRVLVAAAFLLQALRLVEGHWAEPGPLWPTPGVPASFAVGLLEGLRYLAFVVEVVGVGLLFVPGSVAVGALLLSGTAFATLLAQVLVLDGDPLVPLLLFLAGAALVGRRRRELVALWRTHGRSQSAALLPARQR